jgi:hypothetical protein
MNNGMPRNLLGLAIIIFAFFLSGLLVLFVEGKSLGMSVGLSSFFSSFNTDELSTPRQPAVDISGVASNEFQPTPSTISPTQSSLVARQPNSTSPSNEPVAHEGHNADYQCKSANVPSGIQDVVTDKVYRWVDKDGTTHFSDSLPDHQSAELLSSNLEPDFFNLKVSFPRQLAGDDLENAISVGGKAVYKIYANYMPLAMMTKASINISIHNDRESLNQFRSRGNSTVNDASSGFYSWTHNQAFILRQPTTAGTYSVALHEITHAINAGNFGRTPKWYNEGIAEVFEKIKVEGTLTLIPPNEVWLNRLGGNLKYMSLRQLLESTSEDWAGSNETTYYANAWSLAYYLMQPANEQFMRRLQMALTKDRCKALNSIDFVEQEYPGGINALEKGWSRWRQNRQPASLRF